MAQVPFTPNPALVAIVNDYSQTNARDRGYIADIVAPRVDVDDILFRYREFPISEAFTIYDNQVSREGRLNEIVQSASETTGSVLDYGLLEKVSYRDEASWRSQRMPLTLKARAARTVVDRNQLAREVRVASMVTTLANYQTGYKTDLSAGTKWSDYTNSDPAALAMAAAQGMLLTPNIAVMSLAVRNTLRRHPKLSVALGGSALSGRYLDDDDLAKALGVQRIVVGNTLKQTSKRGQAVTTAAIWPDSVALLHVPSVGGNGFASNPEDPAFLLTFQYGGPQAGEIQYQRGEFGLWGGVGVWAGESLVEKAVAPFAGYLFSSVL